MPQNPSHLILPDKVYKLSMNRQETGRSFDRGLVDYLVDGTNPLSDSDKWKTVVGSSEEIFWDYKTLKLHVPLEWLISRFLCHFVRTNSVDLLGGPGGAILTTKNYKDYLGKTISEDDNEAILKDILKSWARTFPESQVILADLYASTDIPFDDLVRSINGLRVAGYIQDAGEQNYKINANVFVNRSQRMTSLDRKNNRYFQEVTIQAAQKFCFVLMPFKEEEFPQTVYFEVIKPLLRTGFHVEPYRVDEDYLPDRIDNKIYSYIMKAAFIVAEVTTSNPNVMYEIGLAHMLEKDCIIVTQTPLDKVPFDIRRIRAEYYNSETTLREILKRSITALGFPPRQ